MKSILRLCEHDADVKRVSGVKGVMGKGCRHALTIHVSACLCGNMISYYDVTRKPVVTGRKVILFLFIFGSQFYSHQQKIQPN